MENVKYTANSYKNVLKPVWCPGCGDYGVLASIHQTLAELQLAPENVAVVSGIGCSSRLPNYMTTFGFHTVHGRALPVATGVKVANPELTVLTVSGDGDALSIGMGHFPHAIRKNVDLTMFLMNNNIYGLTKGQTSPTTPINEKTPSSHYGNFDKPINPLELGLAAGATFVANVFTADMKMMKKVFVEAIKHKGFSLIQVLTPCVTYRGAEQFKTLREMTYNLPDDYDVSNKEKAFDLAREIGRGEKIACGIWYQEQGALDLGTNIQNTWKEAKPVAEDNMQGFFDELLVK